MITLWYTDIQQLNLQSLSWLLDELPLALQEEILRKRLMSDKKSKLVAKLLIRQFHQLNDRWYGWGKWKLGEHKKPALNEGFYFNVSHSGSIVTVAFSDQPVGVDVEEENEVNIDELSGYFHQEESHFINGSENKLDAFYTIWTRKEAYLKALGIGVLNGLNNENTLLSRINQWNIFSVPIRRGYKMAISTPLDEKELTIKEINIQEIIPEIIE